ncbi:glutaminyl-peptide cyclotransferase [Sphingomonas sp.]|uniref:glutaminyl-peptide cyclotransferase n=1 Tax=Sphingomonas sp. TaxID=28214 RepID=UPI002EDAE971
MAGAQSPATKPAPPATQAQPAIPILAATIVARHPHDPTAFTEGLAWANGSLYESTGLEGRSEVRRVSLDGRITARATLDPAQFGEGLAIWRDQVITLTWHDGIAHRWNARNLKRIGTAHYLGDGWGLAAAGDTLALTDGTPILKFYDAATFRERRRVTVTLRGKPLAEVNELEYVDGALLANVWHTGFLVRIDAASGKVTALVDLRPLIAEIAATDPEAVANGIAWDAKARRLFVTGKLWPTIFEVKIG